MTGRRWIALLVGGLAAACLDSSARGQTDNSDGETTVFGTVEPTPAPFPAVSQEAKLLDEPPRGIRIPTAPKAEERSTLPGLADYERSAAPAVAPVAPAALAPSGEEPTVVAGTAAPVSDETEPDAPSILLLKKFPTSVKQGEPIAAELVVKNTGKATALDLLVTATFSPNVEILESTPKAEGQASALKWTVGKLEPGQQKRIALRLTARGSKEQPTISCNASISFGSVVAKDVAVLRPQLELDVTGPTTGNVGEPMTFILQASNKGTASASGVRFRDPLPSGLTHPQGPELENEIGAVAPGETKKVKLTVTPSQPGKIVHTVCLTADGVEKIEKQLALQIEDVKLVLESVGPKVRYLQRPCTVELKIHNQGSASAKAVQLTAAMPKGLSFAHASDDGKHDPVGQQVQWAIAEIKPGETKTIALTGIAVKTGDQLIKAELTAGKDLHQSTAWTTRVDGVAALQIELIDLEDPIELGQETVYEVRIINQGSIPITHVKVEATAPSDLEPVAADGPGPHQLAAGTLRFEPLEAIAPKADVSFRIKARGKKVGDHRFRVTVTADQLTKPVVKEESTTVFGEEQQ